MNGVHTKKKSSIINGHAATAGTPAHNTSTVSAIVSRGHLAVSSGRPTHLLIGYALAVERISGRVQDFIDGHETFLIRDSTGRKMGIPRDGHLHNRE